MMHLPFALLFSAAFGATREKEPREFMPTSLRTCQNVPKTESLVTLQQTTQIEQGIPFKAKVRNRVLLIDYFLKNTDI